MFNKTRSTIKSPRSKLSDNSLLELVPFDDDFYHFCGVDALHDKNDNR